MKAALVFGRDYFNTVGVCSVLDEENPDLVIEGAATGADTSAGVWADTKRKYHLHCPADWDTYGKSAGPRRNAEMASILMALRGAGWECFGIAFPGGRGTEDMRKLLVAKGFDVLVVDPTSAPAREEEW
jgi:hypothetical protein